MLSHSAKPAGLRMNRRIRRETDEVPFGSQRLAVNGCEACIESHAPSS